jgi:chemosensory pili system protein ChpA (sensor histidine kinase/response regulator)
MAGSLDKSSIIEFFLIEAGEHLQNLNKGLVSLEKAPSDMDLIDELFRAAHTLKGSAAMMGFQGVSDVAHTAEDMLGQFRSGALPICKETLNFLFDSVDAVKLMVDGVAANQPEDALVVESITRAYKDVNELFSNMPVAPDETFSEETAGSVSSDPQSKQAIDLAWENAFGEATGESVVVEPFHDEVENDLPSREPLPAPAVPSASDQHSAAGMQLKEEIEAAKNAGFHEKRGLGRRSADTIDLEKQFIRVDIDRLDNLMNLVGEMIVNRNGLARQVDFIKSLREELAFSQARLVHEIKKFEEKYEYTLSVEAPGHPEAVQSGDFLELEFDRYDDFNLLSRKLTEITNDTNEIMAELAGFFDSFELDTARISLITTNLQNEITMARMVEMDKLYQLLQRPVRDLAQEEGKQLKLVVLGGETTVDKSIFETISDPLMHMIRNAVSHGIEPPAERTALGKEPTGVLILNARHEGNNIIIEVEDDGRGMDPAALRKAAVDKGFMSAAEAQSLTDIEAINLIFRPGFSTASTVGRVSGRGVGMDVVATQIARINGRFEITTDTGVGTKFLIRLPLTLAIAQALIVKLGDQEMAVPMSLVEETTRYSYKDIQQTASEEMVILRGSPVRLLKLNELLGVGTFPKKDETYRHPTLILGMAEKRIAVMVEAINGREEIVVKTLGDYLKGIKFFSGATISGEGDVRLILNIASLFGDEVLVTSAASVAPVKEAAAPEPLMRKLKLLVVDDSISIRKYVQRFLDRMGYDVEVASDGMEALNVMDRMKFDAVITDLEMPVMHGYDLMAEMKQRRELMNIPVIVLTSRAGDKHRQKAREMGAHDYLVKPFEEQELLGTLTRVLSGVTSASRS